ncbi:MAG: tetratricopeptide repeat protein [Bacteroidota bacterium]
MDRIQWAVISLAVALFFVMYFGCDTKPGKHKIIEKQRVENAESTNISSLLLAAKEDITTSDAPALMSLEMELESAGDDSTKVETLKSLSSMWYRLGKPAIAGHYAEEIAMLENSENAWSIAGTTYSICVQRESEAKVKEYCTDHAISSLENASSLNPANPQHKINLALVYTESPPSDNPMKGILMLVEMNKQDPDNVSVLNQLGRLAIKTGQFDKAIERLGRAVELEPGNSMSNCLYGQALKEKGDQSQASVYLARCEELTID